MRSAIAPQHINMAVGRASMRELLRADEKRQAEEQLEAQLLEGLGSAESELTPEDWCAIRKEALAKLEERKLPR